MAPYHVTAEENGPLVVVSSAIMMTYMVLCYLVRVFMRFTINGPFGKDDWSLTIGSLIAVVQTGLKISEAYAGLGRRRHLVPLEEIERIEKLAYAGDIFYLVALAFSRVSTFLLIARVTRQKNHLRAASLGAIGSMVISITSVFLICMRCDLSRPWNLISPGCSQMYSRWYTVETLGILVELYAAWVPIYLLWSLQMQIKSKLIVLFAFSFRLPVLVAAGARLYYLRQQQMHEDILFSGAAASVCLEVELHYGLMAATIPCLKPFVKLFNTGWFDTRAMHSTSGGEQYALSNIQPTGSTEDKSTRRKWNDRRHVRSQGSSAPSSAGSDIMIIRQTTAWDVTYDTNDQTV
ncbi:hypothetical protein GY631_0310 [Trichophyton interdigitale]|uniref:Rhodopsin domain-containing protein n=1 Tax=Trichophyton interdigitale (strain MR816) TaxID=1215338 RepID=A0A059J2P4_TRIIM|nr:hypothetical protein H101_07229 [Trichophyton interdigitale H6]KAF3900010.1 hypothetical protein GY631_0310 [Trichophyton interdigitale]KAG5217564.1 hypothetical protein GY632_6432 [Trichophyton interdigitale]KDB22059.1 hypothetical protein H109_06008 [Trichophyton interdigitale MR816]